MEKKPDRSEIIAMTLLFALTLVLTVLKVTRSVSLPWLWVLVRFGLECAWSPAQCAAFLRQAARRSPAAERRARRFWHGSEKGNAGVLAEGFFSLGAFHL